VPHNNKLSQCLVLRRNAETTESTDSSNKMGRLGTERPLGSRGTRDQTVSASGHVFATSLSSFQAASTADTDASYIVEFEIQIMALLSHVDIGKTLKLSLTHLTSMPVLTCQKFSKLSKSWSDTEVRTEKLGRSIFQVSRSSTRVEVDLAISRRSFR
jgi:hypothetical protein